MVEWFVDVEQRWRNKNVGSVAGQVTRTVPPTRRRDAYCGPMETTPTKRKRSKLCRLRVPLESSLRYGATS